MVRIKRTIEVLDVGDVAVYSSDGIVNLVDVDNDHTIQLTSEEAKVLGEILSVAAAEAE
jgi:hypothetical protein